MNLKWLDIMKQQTNIPNWLKKKVFLWDILNPEELEVIYENVCSNINYVKYLINMEVDLNKQDETGCYLLHWCYDNKEIVEILIKNIADINIKNKSGQTPLHKASYNGHKEIVELLIQNGADVNVKDKWGDTPLHRASRCGHKEIVKLLIQNGANINIKDYNSWTPLHQASFYSHKETVGLLKQHGAKTGEELKKQEGNVY